jgi:hypothetical protein
MGNECLIHHEVHNLAGRVKAARLVASRCSSVLVVGCQKIFKDLAEQLGVERGFLFKGRVLFDRELVAVEKVRPRM